MSRNTNIVILLIVMGSLGCLALVQGSDSVGQTEEFVFLLKGVPQKLRLSRFPCSCQEYTCGCCASMNLETFNFSRRGHQNPGPDNHFAEEKSYIFIVMNSSVPACMNFTYDPYDFSVTANMLMNDSSIFSTSFSAKNPPRACLPIIIPYIPIPMELCARFFNICTPGTNVHFCMDWEFRVIAQPIAIAHFDCLRAGADGLTLMKPQDDGCQPPSPPGDPSDDVYDEVVEE